VIDVYEDCKINERLGRKIEQLGSMHDLSEPLEYKAAMFMNVSSGNDLRSLIIPR
jgi:hypothetical protein